MGEPVVDVRDAADRQQFELVVDGAVAAFTSYATRGRTRVFLHTEVDPAYKGQGLGSRLVAEAVDRTRRSGLTVRATCPFVRGFLRREFEEQVLGVVRLIPAGFVMSYGDIAEYLGAGGPRQVGQVMSRSEGDVPWWRVIHADGSPPPGKEDECLAQLRAEGVPMRPDGNRVDMRRARWDGRTGVAPSG